MLTKNEAIFLRTLVANYWSELKKIDERRNDDFFFMLDEKLMEYSKRTSNEIPWSQWVPAVGLVIILSVIVHLIWGA